MKKYEKQPWTSDERNVLRDYYYVLSMEQLLDVLPGEVRMRFVNRLRT